MIGTGIALALGALSAGGKIAGSVIGGKGASKAAEQQTNAAQQAIDLQNQRYQETQGNFKPYMDAGQYSIGQLMEGLQNGTFGPGSIPGFKAPTAQEARDTPGYQFTKTEGTRGVLASAAARGAGLSGGALKSLDRYTTGLADSTYGGTFNRALSTYDAQLRGQTQGFNQLSSLAGGGQQAATTLGQFGQNSATNIGQLMTGIGNAQASGTLGKASAWQTGLSGATNTFSDLLANQGMIGSPSPQLIQPGYNNPYLTPYQLGVPG
jgi:hypothetical protein